MQYKAVPQHGGGRAVKLIAKPDHHKSRDFAVIGPPEPALMPIIGAFEQGNAESLDESLGKLNEMIKFQCFQYSKWELSDRLCQILKSVAFDDQIFNEQLRQKALTSIALLTERYSFGFIEYFMSIGVHLSIKHLFPDEDRSFIIPHISILCNLCYGQRSSLESVFNIFPPEVFLPFVRPHEDEVAPRPAWDENSGRSKDIESSVAKDGEEFIQGWLDRRPAIDKVAQKAFYILHAYSFVDQSPGPYSQAINDCVSRVQFEPNFVSDFVQPQFIFETAKNFCNSEEFCSQLHDDFFRLINEVISNSSSEDLPYAISLITSMCEVGRFLSKLNFYSVVQMIEGKYSNIAAHCINAAFSNKDLAEILLSLDTIPFIVACFDVSDYSVKLELTIIIAKAIEKANITQRLKMIDYRVGSLLGQAICLDNTETIRAVCASSLALCSALDTKGLSHRIILECFGDFEGSDSFKDLVDSDDELVLCFLGLWKESIEEQIGDDGFKTDEDEDATL